MLSLVVSHFIVKNSVEPIVFDRDRYRGLRGLVKNVLRVWQEKIKDPYADHRTPTAGIGLGKNFEKCVWCGLPAINERTGRKLKWHESCALYQSIASGAKHYMVRLDDGSTRMKSVCARQTCVCGAEGEEMDHILAIGVARRLGIRVYALAFLPENLWWLCHSCHSAKTSLDRAWMRDLDRIGVPDKQSFEIGTNSPNTTVQFSMPGFEMAIASEDKWLAARGKPIRFARVPGNREDPYSFLRCPGRLGI